VGRASDHLPAPKALRLANPAYSNRKPALVLAPTHCQKRRNHPLAVEVLHTERRHSPRRERAKKRDGLRAGAHTHISAAEKGFDVVLPGGARFEVVPADEAKLLAESWSVAAPAGLQEMEDEC
jgi:hypothetical protein